MSKIKEQCQNRQFAARLEAAAGPSQAVPDRSQRGSPCRPRFHILSAPSRCSYLPRRDLAARIRPRRRTLTASRVFPVPAPRLAQVRTRHLPPQVPQLHGLPVAARAGRPASSPIAPSAGIGSATRPKSSLTIGEPLRQRRASSTCSAATTTTRPPTSAGETEPIARTRYHDSFVDNPFPTEEWLYFLEGKLVGIGYVDALPVGLSAIYFVHDPDHRDRGLGIWNVLSLIEETRRRGLPHLYLGYYVAGMPLTSLQVLLQPPTRNARRRSNRRTDVESRPERDPSDRR